MMKKIPMRQCTGCAEHKPKKELIRVVKSPDGVLSIDATGKAAGRGAYICKDINCLELSIKKKRLETCLGVTVAPEIYETLKKELSGIE